MHLKIDAKILAVAAAGLATLASGSLVADNRPPAGQMCPEGAYVIGFDADSNIVCSDIPGAGPVETPETTQAVKPTGGDACPEGCAKIADGAAVVAGNAAEPPPAQDQSAGDNGAGPVISGIKPKWVVFGARETAIRIIGSGFTSGTIVKFQGATYTPSVNAAGTELRVTLETRDLRMGRYAITISNGEGKETTQRRALEVF